MPYADAEAQEEDTLLEQSRDGMVRLWDGFVGFAFSGNILQIAFGLILAANFTALVTSFVADILMPPISIILPLNKNIEEKFAILRRGDTYDEKEGYNTLQQAQDDGAVVMAWGAFVYQIVSFIMVGISLYGLAQLYQLVSRDTIIKDTKKCKYCRQTISQKSARCVNCTSWQDGREDRVRY